jgi:hypothetical protein
MDQLLRQRTVWLSLPALLLLAWAAVARPDLAASSLAGFLGGAVACWLLLRPAQAAATAEAEALRATLEAGKHTIEDATSLLETTARLRHDLNGILSPTLLTADRLLAHEDPTIRRAGEIVVKTVERASARLAETRPHAQPHKPAG